MYFTYNGVDSRDVGLKIKDLPFDIMPQRRVKELILDKYDGTIYSDEDTYESFPFSIECYMIDNFTPENIRGVKNLLKSGKGELIFSHKPNHIYNVRLTSTINFVEMLSLTGSCILSFKVEPFAMLKSGRAYKQVRSGDKLVNEGNFHSKPLYKITGSGDFSIKVNSSTMEFIGVPNKTIIVDVELEDVYDEYGANQNNYLTLKSDFLPLNEGENVITFTGSISRVDIMPRWREL